MNYSEKGKQTREKMKQSIIQYMQAHGYPPTIREIGKMVGLKSTNTVQMHINKMIANGELETDAKYGSPRAIRVPGYKFIKE